MLNFLPRELENTILHFLIMPRDVSTIVCVSKKCKYKMKNLAFFREKEILQNRANMILEDNFYQIAETKHNTHLANIWEYYHKWEWSFMNKDIKITNLENGNYIDALDNVHTWCPAKILKQKIEVHYDYQQVETLRKLFYVQFLGWSDAFNEWVTIEKISPLGTKTINPINPYESIHKHKSWCLYNCENNWYMVNISLYEEKAHEKLVHFNSFRGNFLRAEVITKKNINQKMRYISNGTVLLTIPNRGFYTAMRTLKF